MKHEIRSVCRLPFSAKSPKVIFKRVTTKLWALFLALVLINTSNISAADSPRVLVLIAQGFNKTEFLVPTTALSAAGCTLTIASVKRGIVPLDVNGTPRSGSDAEAALGIDEVDPAAFDALFVPGGYSPGFLEKEPRVLEIVRAFDAAHKPIGMICHGPRLLIRAGLAKGRNFTCLFGVADELAEVWRERPFKAYFDQPVVIDGNLITARFPGDAAPFAQEMIDLITGKKKIDLPAIPKLPAENVFPSEGPPIPDAVVALRDGFDERVVAAAIGALKERGRTAILLVGAKIGALKSLNGVEVQVAGLYSSEKLFPGCIIVAPGFFWPQKNAEARQAVQPKWIDDQERADVERADWLLRQREAGAMLVAVGLDALRIGKLPQFKGNKFATTDQAMWSFPKGAGTYSRDPFFLTADRLVTARDAAAIRDAIFVAALEAKR